MRTLLLTYIILVCFHSFFPCNEENSQHCTMFATDKESTFDQCAAIKDPGAFPPVHNYVLILHCLPTI